MINFTIISNDVLFKAKVEKNIHKYLNNKKYSYKIYYNQLILKNNNKKIYIADLEKENIIEDIKKINELKNNDIICITGYINKKIDILQRHLLVYDFINRFDNLENSLIKCIDNILKNKVNKNEKIIIKSENRILTIYLEEIDEIISILDKTLIKSTNNMNVKYIYQLDISINKIKEKLKGNSNFIQINDNIIVNINKNNFNKNLYFKIKKNNKKYDLNYKNKIVSSYYDGKTIEKLSHEYKPSYTTIRNWIIKDKNDKLIKKYKNKVEKYDEIVKIVNR